MTKNNKNKKSTQIKMKRIKGLYSIYADIDQTCATKMVSDSGSNESHVRFSESVRVANTGKKSNSTIQYVGNQMSVNPDGCNAIFNEGVVYWREQFTITEKKGKKISTLIAHSVYESGGSAEGITSVPVNHFTVLSATGRFSEYKDAFLLYHSDGMKYRDLVLTKNNEERNHMIKKHKLV